MSAFQPPAITARARIDRRTIRRFAFLLATAFATALATPSLAEVVGIGGDVHLADRRASLSGGNARDAFVAGFSTTFDGEVAGDAHLAGFSITSNGTVGEDLYAAGASVDIEGPVGADLTVSGFTVNVADTAAIGGNARLAGGDVTLDAPIYGSLLAAAATLRLDGVIDGDARLTAAELTFGEDARVGGVLTYTSPEPIDVPASVASAERVRYVPPSAGSVLRDVREATREPMPDVWPGLVTGTLMLLTMLAFLLLLATVLFAFAPNRIETVRRRAEQHAWYAIVFGFLGLAILFGAVPVSLMTLVGIPFAPIVLLSIPIFWTLGYLLGVYALGARVWQAFDGTFERLPAKLAIVAIGLALAAALNFLPIIGWLLNVAILLFGLGAITIVMLDALVAHTRERAREDRIALPDGRSGAAAEPAQ